MHRPYPDTPTLRHPGTQNPFAQRGGMRWVGAMSKKTSVRCIWPMAHIPVGVMHLANNPKPRRGDAFGH